MVGAKDAAPYASRRIHVIHLVLLILSMATAIAVRLPSALMQDIPFDAQEPYTAEDGLPYLTDQDSYFHARIMQNHIDHGSLGNTVNENGIPWDTLRCWPEGRSAEYQPGIVWVTQALWGTARLFGASLRAVEFCFPAVMAALAVCAAYVMGSRMAGPVGGLAAGMLVSCAPGFVSRTTFGRFDTDGLVILCEVLVLLSFCEAIRSRNTTKRLLAIFGFVFASIVYTLCWTPQNAILFVFAILLGGILAMCIRLAMVRSNAKKDHKPHAQLRKSELLAPVLCIALVLASVLALFGPAFFTSVIDAVRTTATIGNPTVLPNIYASISEMRVPALVRGGLPRWFAGYAAGGQMTILDGVGGATVGVLSVAALVTMTHHALRPHSKGIVRSLSREDVALYLCVLGILTLCCLYACTRGVRFIEHLAIPAGILSGALIGWTAQSIGNKQKTARAGKAVLVIILCAIAMLPSISGARRSSLSSRPAVTDASAQAMCWIRNNAKDENAVIASWWDNGYYYEYASGHPCLWDGGSQDGVRYILMGRALTTHDSELSTCILHMLAQSGNRAIDCLMSHASTHDAFEALFESLTMEKEQSVALFQSRCGLSPEEAVYVESLVHPVTREETYLVVTSAQMLQLGLYEYYGEWDFSGTTPVPAFARYDLMPDGTPIKETKEGRELLEKRSKETIWRLIIDGEIKDHFTPAFDADDGIDHVFVWRVE